MIAKRNQTTGTAAAAEPSELVRGLLAKERTEAIRAASARRDELKADLSDARVEHEAAQRLRSAAEAQWALNEPNHTSAEAQRLEQRRAQDAAAAAHVADLSRELNEVEAELRDLSRNEQRERAQKLAAEAWPPMVRKVMQQARAFRATLAEQAKVREQLADAGAWGLVAVEDLVMPDATYLGDPCEAITRWLEACERAGFQ